MIFSYFCLIVSSHPDNAYFIAFMFLYSEDKQHRRVNVINPFIHLNDEERAKSGVTRTLCLHGTVVSQCYVLNDTNGMKAHFFVFPEVSCRITGKYRLCYEVYNIKEYVS